MFVAGVSENTGEKALKLWHLRNATSFNGCLKEVYVNDKLVDFLQAAKTRHKVAPGCNMYQDEQPDILNPCKAHQCKEGQCTPAKGSRDGYKCVCRTGYEGQYCGAKILFVAGERKRGRSWQSKQRPTSKKCRKEKYRDYYIEPDGCRSVKPYKMSNCVGANRCGATKTRARAVRFVCGDGRKYKKCRSCTSLRPKKWEKREKWEKWEKGLVGLNFVTILSTLPNRIVPFMLRFLLH